VARGYILNEGDAQRLREMDNEVSDLTSGRLVGRRNRRPKRSVAATSYVKSVSYDSGDGEFTVVLGEVRSNTVNNMGTSSLSNETIEETTFLFSAPASPRTFNFYVTKWHNNTIDPQYIWEASSFGTYGADDFTDSREFVPNNYFGMYRAASITLQPSGDYSLFSDGIPEVYLPEVGAIPRLSWNGPTGESTTPTSGTLGINGVIRTRTRINGSGQFPYWNSDSPSSLTVPPSTDSGIYFGCVDLDSRSGDSGKLVLATTGGLTSYMEVGYIKTDANGNVLSLLDYTNWFRVTWPGLTTTIRRVSSVNFGAETVTAYDDKYIDGVLVKSTLVT